MSAIAAPASRGMPTVSTPASAKSEAPSELGARPTAGASSGVWAEGDGWGTKPAASEATPEVPVGGNSPQAFMETYAAFIEHTLRATAAPLPGSFEVVRIQLPKDAVVEEHQRMPELYGHVGVMTVTHTGLPFYIHASDAPPIRTRPAAPPTQSTWTSDVQSAGAFVARYGDVLERWGAKVTVLDASHPAVKAGKEVVLIELPEGSKGTQLGYFLADRVGDVNLLKVTPEGYRYDWEHFSRPSGCAAPSHFEMQELAQTLPLIKRVRVDISDQFAAHAAANGLGFSTADKSTLGVTVYVPNAETAELVGPLISNTARGYPMRVEVAQA